ncbi:uncharacterized protein B0P05DRAFT_473269 [Gilbertella persicaria]|uniref:uncharacterized protein n=1 Tax=Gilbertella persicaria TaxID=101096 RepID=UPI002220B92C|nr:uncharacterized protein B0P05DRAFT_473269 [Gilbertella persicaria]KAI8074313.1 hypothetical protein B0P05DRAFT_473269 [Gilbertella persicaria]
MPIDEAMHFIKSIPSIEYLQYHLGMYASRCPLAGSKTDKSLTEWTKESWIRYGIKDTHIETYYPVLNYPQQRRVALLRNSTVVYEATLGEAKGDGMPPFHAYSANGNVTAPVVYVDYGRWTDFQFLSIRGIELNGTIALVRTGGDITHGLKIKMAEKFGCVGVLVFPDPENSRDVLDRVEKGSAQYGYYSVGDPFTVGYPAIENATYTPFEKAKNIPKIPSLPISLKDALPILEGLEGNGIQKITGPCYFSGPSKAAVNLVNINDYKARPIWNVVGRIKGHAEPQRAIIVGHHRDAWDDGAVNPSTGSAVLTELVRTLGILLEKGWKPRRTIIIASWDAQKYGSVGSTEWVEHHKAWLQEEAVAYLNVDNAVSGKYFTAQASPLLNQLLYQVTHQVQDPDTGDSIYTVWKSQHEALQDKHVYFTSFADTQENKSVSLTKLLTTDADHTAFFSHLGISSLSIGFKNKVHGMQHGLYGTIDRADVSYSTLQYHQALTQLWGLLALRLSSDRLLPLNPHDYALEMNHSIHKISAYKGCSGFSSISLSLRALTTTSVEFKTQMDDWHQQLLVKKHYSRKLKQQIAQANQRLLEFEKAFIDPHGLSSDRPWFKHLIYGPDLSTGETVAFPSLMDVIENDDFIFMQREEKRISHAIHHAQTLLLS